MPYRIVLADDHRIIREGIKSVIHELSDMEVIGEAADGMEVVRLTRELVPDMVILDIAMPKLTGIEATREIKALAPNVKVLVLTVHKDSGHLHQAISAGADGYLLKDDADMTLLSAVERIRQNGQFVSSLLTRKPAESFMQMRNNNNESIVKELTMREIEILTLLAEGRTSREIGNLLRISVHTVENHRSRIRKKLGLRKNIQLIRYAVGKGYISLD